MREYKTLKGPPKILPDGALRMGEATYIPTDKRVTEPLSMPNII